MSSRDIIQLKIQKRLIEEHLKSTDDRLDRLSGILAKKKADHPSKLPYDENGITSVGRTVADFRIPSRTIKATAHPTADISYGQATAISNERILTIRQQHQMRTNGRQEVNQKLKARELEELRKQKPEKKAPLMKIPESLLPNRYTRGELPCTIEHGTSGKYLSWACPLENLDYEYYLPLFFDGLQCKDKVVGFIARQGIEDMLYASKGHPERIKPIVHSLARPLRNALAKFDTEILLGVLKALEQLILCNEGIGEVLLPYSRQFLVPIAYFMDQNRNIGDAMDFGQRRQDDIGEEIRKILELMEEHGGPKALQHIKFSIPLYESCLRRPDAHHAGQDSPSPTNHHK